MNTIQKAINKLINGKNLSRAESRKVMHAIMSGEGTDAQISAFLVSLRIKGETVDLKMWSIHVAQAVTRSVHSIFLLQQHWSPLVQEWQWPNMATGLFPVNQEVQMY